MKRFWSVVLVGLVSLVASSGIALAGASPKAVGVSVAWTETIVQVGDTLELTATTPKHGSAFTDGWSGATKVSTLLNSDGYYVSRATFSPGQPGLYTVTYNITMSAGKSDVAWEGRGTGIITVLGDPSNYGYFDDAIKKSY